MAAAMRLLEQGADGTFTTVLDMVSAETIYSAWHAISDRATPPIDERITVVVRAATNAALNDVLLLLDDLFEAAEAHVRDVVEPVAYWIEVQQEGAGSVRALLFGGGYESAETISVNNLRTQEKGQAILTLHLQRGHWESPSASLIVDQTVGGNTMRALNGNGTLGSRISRLTLKPIAENQATNLVWVGIKPRRVPGETGTWFQPIVPLVDGDDWDGTETASHVYFDFAAHPTPGLHHRGQIRLVDYGSVNADFRDWIGRYRLLLRGRNNNGATASRIEVRAGFSERDAVSVGSITLFGGLGGITRWHEFSGSLQIPTYHYRPESAAYSIERFGFFVYIEDLTRSYAGGVEIEKFATLPADHRIVVKHDFDSMILKLTSSPPVETHVHLSTYATGATEAIIEHQGVGITGRPQIRPNNWHLPPDGGHLVIIPDNVNQLSTTVESYDQYRLTKS